MCANLRARKTCKLESVRWRAIDVNLIVRAGQIVTIVFVASTLLIFEQQATSEAQTCPGTITFGDNISCSIDVAGESDSYTFSGSAGDRVYARVGTAGLNSPRVEIKRPSGTTLCASWGTYAATVSCQLDTSGTHQVIAKSQSASATGAYGLYAQLLGNPQNTTPATYGENYTGTLAAGMVEDYTVTVAAGDVIYARVARIGLGGPRIEIRRPDGTSCATWGVYFAETTCTAAAAGAYTVMAMSNDTGSGSFGIHVQRLNNPINTTVATYGENYTGTLAAGTVEDYTVTVAAGDVIYARVARVSLGDHASKSGDRMEHRVPPGVSILPRQPALPLLLARTRLWRCPTTPDRARLGFTCNV
jgi:exosome complex RNA-binding protein Csl4